MPSRPVSRLDGFIDWWARGLLALDRPRNNRAPAWRTMLLCRNNLIEIHSRRGETVQLLGHLDPTAPAEQNRRTAAKVTRDGRLSAALVLRLAPQDVVHTTMTLPAGVRDVLQKVLQNQIERIAPWPVEQALFAFAEQAASADGITVALWVTSGARVEERMAMLSDFELVPGIIDVGADTSAEPAINLRPVETTDQTRLTKARRALVGAMAGAAIVSAAAFGYGLLVDTRNRELEVELQTAVTAANAATKARNPGLQQRQAMAFDLRRAQPSLSILIEALSRALPDGASLERLEFRDDEVTLTGRAQNAPALISRLEASPHFGGVRFVAPTTRQDGESSVQFSIAAKVVAQLVVEPKGKP